MNLWANVLLRVLKLNDKTLFKDVIPSLLQKKDYCYDESLYNSYVVNKALASYPDCIFYVVEISQYPNLDKNLQYDFYYHGLKKYRRPFQKWLKKESIEKEYESIMQYYTYSLSKAKEVHSLLSKEQIHYIVEKVKVGGKL